MSISAVIKKVADKKLAAEGFERKKTKSPGMWLYGRQHGEIAHELYFQKSNYGSAITLVFGGGICGGELSRLVCINDLAPILSNQIRNNINCLRGFFEYKNEEELALLITALTDTAIEKIIPFFEVFVRPNQRPSREMYKELSDNTKIFADRFTRDYYVDYDTEISKIKERIRLIENLIDQKRGAGFDELRELFLAAAAYLGELTIKAHKGYWGWNDNVYEVLDINDNASWLGKSSPIEWCTLFGVIRYWDKPEFYCNTITAEYKGLLDRLGIEDYYDSPERHAMIKTYYKI